MPKRSKGGNRPNRRIAPPGTVSSEIWANLNSAHYTGVCYHKSKHADGYDFAPCPRPDKSLCDDLRPISLPEATRLFRSGIRLGMVSSYIPDDDDLPKVIWAVDQDGEAYEAMLGGDGASYHGYRLYRDENQRAIVIAEWRKRTSQSS